MELRRITVTRDARDRGREHGLRSPGGLPKQEQRPRTPSCSSKNKNTINRRRNERAVLVGVYGGAERKLFWA